MLRLNRRKVLMVLLLSAGLQEAACDRRSLKAESTCDHAIQEDSSPLKGRGRDPSEYGTPLNVYVPKTGGSCTQDDPCEVGFRYKVWPNALYITEIIPNAQIDDWNKDPTMNRQLYEQVQVGDVVTSLNAVTGSGTGMEMKMREDDDLWLVVVHLPEVIHNAGDRIALNLGTFFGKLLNPEVSKQEIRAQINYNILTDPEVQRRLNIARQADFAGIFSRHQQGSAVVINKLGHDINNVMVFHKYSDKYKNVKQWTQLSNNQESSPAFTVDFETGTLSTGFDWWFVAWQHEGKVYATNPHNLGGLRDNLEPWVPSALGKLLGVAGHAVGVPHLVGDIVGELIGHMFTNTEPTKGFKAYTLNPVTKDVKITLEAGGEVMFKGENELSISLTKRTPWEAIGDGQAEVFDAAEKVSEGEHIQNPSSLRKMRNQFKSLYQAVKQL